MKPQLLIVDSLGITIFSTESSTSESLSFRSFIASAVIYSFSVITSYTPPEETAFVESSVGTESISREGAVIAAMPFVTVAAVPLNETPVKVPTLDVNPKSLVKSETAVGIVGLFTI